MHPEEGDKAGGGAGRNVQEHLRALGLSGREKGRLRGDFMTLYSLLRRGRGMEGADLFSLVSSNGMCNTFVRRGSDLS